MSRICTAALLAISTAVLAPPAVAEIVRGRVFEDLNGNGQLDPGELGIAGLRVSNGRDVVRTDATGTYELKVDEILAGAPRIHLERYMGWAPKSIMAPPPHATGS